MYDSAIKYDDIPKRYTVLDQGYEVGKQVELFSFCYDQVKIDNDTKIKNKLPKGSIGTIESIDARGILHVIWENDFRYPLVLGMDLFKLI
jgi:hypothetical protein